MELRLPDTTRMTRHWPLLLDVLERMWPYTADDLIHDANNTLLAASFLRCRQYESAMRLSASTLHIGRIVHCLTSQAMTSLHTVDEVVAVFEVSSEIARTEAYLSQLSFGTGGSWTTYADGLHTASLFLYAILTQTKQVLRGQVTVASCTLAIYMVLPVLRLLRTRKALERDAERGRLFFCTMLLAYRETHPAYPSLQRAIARAVSTLAL